MPLTNSLLAKIKQDFPKVNLQEGQFFAWSPTEKTVFYDSEEANADELILHELSHYLLDHKDYPKDVALLNMEAAAWSKAQDIAGKYGVDITEDTVQDHLDTYRDWLHARSTCPDCTATGYQTGPKEYACPACTAKWRVNEARLCGLKRYRI